MSLLISVALAVYIQNRKSPVNRHFSLFLLIVAAWLTCGFTYYIFIPLLPALLLAQMMAGSFLGFSFYFFTRSVADEGYRMGRRDRLILLPSAVVVAWSLCIMLSPALFDDFASQVWISGKRVHRPADALYLLYSACIAAGFVFGNAVLVRRLRTEPDPRNRQRVKHVLFACIFGPAAAFAMNNIAAIAGMGQYAYYSLLPILLSLGWVAHSIIRHRVWTIEHLLDIIRQREETLAARNRTIEADIDLARDIQLRLLPERIPKMPGLDMHAVYLPVDKMGGDFYDFREGDGTLGIIIADVSGHGIASAFLSSILKMGFQAISTGSADPVAMFAALDALVIQKGAHAMFATASYCVIDIRAMTLSSCRAGHWPLLLLRREDGSIMEVEPRGRALGIPMGKPVFEENTVGLRHGDRILLYTDGILETAHPKGGIFGLERFKEAFLEGCGLSPRDFCDLLIQRLDEFSGHAQRNDDLTVIVTDIGPLQGDDGNN